MNSRQVDDKELLIDQLTQELDNSGTAQYYTRLAYVRLALAGLPADELARLTGKSKPAINFWIRSYIEAGIDALRLHQGKHPKLSASQSAQIQYDLNHKPSDFGYRKTAWTGPLLSEHIRRMHGVDLHPRQCQRILAEIADTEMKKHH